MGWMVEIGSGVGMWYVFDDSPEKCSRIIVMTASMGCLKEAESCRIRKDRKMATKRAKSYDEVQAEAARPFSKRRKIVVGRGGKRVSPRRYRIDTKEAAKMRAEGRKSGSFPNPHRLTGWYGISVQALIDLGIDKAHSFKDVKAQIIAIAKKVPKTIGGKESNAWVQFRDRQAKNATTGKDVNGRIIQTYQVLQRLSGNHRYGEKLQQMHACIDILRDDTGNKPLPMFMLHTGFANAGAVKPVNDMKRKPKAKAPAKTKAKAKAKPKAKAKAKAKVKKVESKVETKVETPTEPATV